jgi:hypothetical protein
MTSSARPPPAGFSPMFTGASCGSRPAPARRMGGGCDDPPARRGPLGRRGRLSDRERHEDGDRHRLLVLADRGRCQLDDPPDVTSLRVVDQFRDRAGRPYGAEVRSDSSWITPAAYRTLFAAADPGPRYATATAARFAPLDLVKLAASSEPPTGPPGTTHLHRHRFVLAGLIIESLTGQPLDQAYRDLVLDPAGMTETWLEAAARRPPSRRRAPDRGAGHHGHGSDSRLGRRGPGEHRNGPRCLSPSAHPGHLLSARGAR